MALPSIDPALIVPIAFISIPVLFIPYYLYTKFVPSKPKYDPKTGIGRGAPGFQTSVRKVSMPPHLALRIRLGEEVSAEEVTEALEEQRLKEEEEERLAKEREEKERKRIPEGVDESWLPDNVTGSGKKGSSRRRKK